MIRFLRLFLLTALVSVSLVPVAAETLWLASVPKSSRPAFSRRSGTLNSLVRFLREDYDQALQEEASYARQARALVLSGPAPKEEALYDQRRLRWESARDISLSRYGRTGPSGFVPATTLASRLVSEGKAFQSAVKPHLARMKTSALNDFIADAEGRLAQLPTCPGGAFAQLRAAAKGLKDADRRRWAGALAAVQPDQVLLPFAERLSAYRAAPPEVADPFFASLLRFEDALAAGALFPDALPAAAAAAWFADRDSGRLTDFPAAAVASLASTLRTLAETDEDRTSAALREYPAVSAALSETLCLAWLAYRRDPSSFSVSLAVDQTLVRSALGRAWRVARSDDPPAAPPPAPLDAAAVAAVESAAASLAAAPGAEELLKVYAKVRTDPGVSALIASSPRYEQVRRRVVEAFNAALMTAEAGAGSRKFSRVHADAPVDPFSPVTLAYRVEGTPGTATSSAVAPEEVAPILAPALARALGWSGADPAAAALWLDARGIVFTIPYLAGAGPLEDGQAALLESGAAVWPPQGQSPTRSAVFHDRLSRAASLAGVPVSFVLSSDDPGRSSVILASLAVAYGQRPTGGELAQ